MKNWLIFGGLFLALFFYLANDSESPSSKNSQSKNTSQAQSYKGYECTGDCSGHNAGYEWAQEKGITDPDDCSGNSNSFIEGCKSYATE